MIDLVSTHVVLFNRSINPSIIIFTLVTPYKIEAIAQIRYKNGVQNHKNPQEAEFAAMDVGWKDISYLFVVHYTSTWLDEDLSLTICGRQVFSIGTSYAKRPNVRRRISVWICFERMACFQFEIATGCTIFRTTFSTIDHSDHVYTSTPGNRWWIDEEKRQKTSNLSCFWQFSTVYLKIKY